MIMDRMKMTRRSDRSGFTIIELLVVIAVVSILAAIVVPIGESVTRQRDRSTCFFNLKTIGMALENYREDFRGFPPDMTETINWQGADHPGLGLYTLFFLTAGHGVPDDQRGSYLSSRNYYHCPSNPVTDLPPAYDNPAMPDDPTLGGWNAYDLHYLRVRPGFPDDRMLIQPFPAPTTVVTWCDYHHRSGRAIPQPGDQALVLWVDQTVDWVTIRYDDGTTVDPATATQRQAVLDRSRG
jgi:prepilin-type N-terminal cleavage/methylation domain-containing protein